VAYDTSSVCILIMVRANIHREPSSVMLYALVQQQFPVSSLNTLSNAAFGDDARGRMQHLSATNAT
jgi:hypothetical protein